MDMLRLRFSKTGKAKYISHLDLMATMRRALLRAGVNLKYSEGFNPHPYISIALPLPIGCGSICELMDVRTEGMLSTDGLCEKITSALPEGLEVTEVYESTRKFSGIAWVEMNGVLHYDKGNPQNATSALLERFNSESIIISKRTKRGVSDLDVAPYMHDIEIADNDGLSIRIRVSAHDPTINPDNLICVVNGTQGVPSPEFSIFTRAEIFDDDLNNFK